MKRTIVILVYASLILILSFFGISAAETQPMDLSQSILYALKNNESVNAAEQEISAADSRFREAIQNWLPKFNMSANMNYYKKTPYQDVTGVVEIVPGIKIPAQYLLSSGFEYYNTNFTLSATQSLLDSGIISANIAKARMNLELARIRYLRAKLSLSSRMTECFYKLLELSRKEQITEKKIHHAKKIQELIERKHAEGKTGFLDVLESQLKVAKYEHELMSVARNKAQKQDEFAQLVNSPSSEAFVINSGVIYTPFSMSDWNKIMQETTQCNPDIREALINIKINEYEIDAAKSDIKPSVNLFGNVQYFKTGNTFTGSIKDFDRSWSAGLSANWAFFDSGKSLSKISAARYDLKKSKYDSSNIIKNITLKAREAYYDLKDAEGQVSIFQKQKAIAAEKSDMTKRSYKRGGVSQVEMEEKQIAEEEATMDETKSIIDYEIMKTRLSEIIGKEK